jgi:hypothetical protein
MTSQTPVYDFSIDSAMFAARSGREAYGMVAELYREGHPLADTINIFMPNFLGRLPRENRRDLVGGFVKAAMEADDYVSRNFAGHSGSA